MDTYSEPSADTTAPSGNEPALFHSLSKLSCFLGGIFLIVCLVAVCVHILSRVLGLGIAGGDEIARYAMAFSGFLGFAYAFAEKAQVRVDFVLGLLKGRVRRVWEAVLSVALAIGLAGLIYYWGKMTYSSFAFSSIISGYLPIKAWIVQGVLFIGLFLFLLQVILYFVSLVSKSGVVVEATTESAL